MSIISQELALLITGKAESFVTAAAKSSQSAEALAVSEAKAEAAAARLQAATDRLAASEARLALQQAKTAGDSNGITSAQTTLAAAQERSTTSKAAAVVAADQLSVAELRAKAATAGLGQEGAKAGGLFGGLTGASLGLSGGLAGVAGAAAGVGLAFAGFKVISDGVAKFVQLGDQLHTTELLTGGTATEVSQLVGQLKQLGIDPDTAARALQRLGASIGDGSTKLGQFGVQVALNKDGTVNLMATLENLRAAYNGSADAATKDAIAKQLGLRSAQELVPLLALNKEQIQQLNAATAASGGIFSQSDIDKAHELSIASGQLHQAWDNFEITLAKHVVPALKDVVEFAKPAVEILGKIVTFTFDVVTVDHLSSRIHNLVYGRQQDTAATQDQTTANDQLGGAYGTVSDAADRLTSALTGELDARRAVTDAANSLADANQRESDAQDSLNKLLAQGPVDEAAVASAKEELANASSEVTRALGTEQQAQDALNKARQTASALDLEDAQNKIDLATDSIGAARAAAEQAKEKYDALLGSGSASAGEIAAAQADLKTKQDEVTKSIIDQHKAQGDLTTLRQKGSEADPAVISAEQAVQNARDGVTGALRRQADAESKLRTTEAGDPEYARKIADARRALADAHQAVADAQDNQVRTALDLHKATDTLNGSLDGNAAAIAAVRAELETLNGEGVNTDSLLGLLSGLQSSSAIPTEAANTFWSFLTHPPTTWAAEPAGPIPTPAAPASGLKGPNFAGGRAGGGPVEPGMTYLVGENGPELLRMGSASGWIQAHGTSGSGGPVVQQIFYGYPTDIIGTVAAREAALSIHSVVPAHISRS